MGRFEIFRVQMDTSHLLLVSFPFFLALSLFVTVFLILLQHCCVNMRNRIPTPSRFRTAGNDQNPEDQEEDGEGSMDTSNFSLRIGGQTSLQSVSKSIGKMAMVRETSH